MVKIEKEVLTDGTVRWRARGVSTGKDPVTGKRTQRTITGKTKKEVEAEVRRIGHEVDKGTYVKPWDGTVDELLDAWLRGPASDLVLALYGRTAEVDIEGDSELAEQLLEWPDND